MSNIIIEKAPRGYTMDYSECIIVEKGKLTEGIQKIHEFYYNSSKENYGPFEGDDAISFLKLLDYEDRVS